jgi:Hemerythrin HHE cation binding domain
MHPNEMRTELLSQHANLRETIEQVRRGAGCVQGNDQMRAELRIRVGRLSKSLHEHNRREEELLRGFLATVDVWGPVREQVMNEEHLAEHVELCSAFVDATVVSDWWIPEGTLIDVLDRVLEHMAREERLFLSRDLLGDDTAVVDHLARG